MIARALQARIDRRLEFYRLGRLPDETVSRRVRLGEIDTAVRAEGRRGGADLKARSQELVLRALGVEQPDSPLLMALSGWIALERAVCLSWLEHPETPRMAVEELLLSTFIAMLAAVAPYGAQAQAVLAHLHAEA